MCPGTINELPVSQRWRREPGHTSSCDDTDDDDDEEDGEEDGKESEKRKDWKLRISRQVEEKVSILE